MAFYYAQIISGNVSQEVIKDYIVAESLIIGVNPQLALGIAKAESGFDLNNVGDHGTSKGLWQIHLPAHKDISSDQAFDPIFSTVWSLKEMKKNGCGIWSTCKAVKSQLRANLGLTRASQDSS